MQPLFTHAPDRIRALASYAALADSYDSTCLRIKDARNMAAHLLHLQDGETVFDVACGTGPLLPTLADLVAPSGSVVGIEQSQAMAAIAFERGALCRNAEVIISPVEEFTTTRRADALLLCYTQDVLQSPAALANLFAHTKPGARVAVVGSRFVSWWLAPVNLFTAYRARRYTTTFRGFRHPWKPLLGYCPELQVVRSYHAGTSYLATGIFRPPCDGRWAAQS